MNPPPYNPNNQYPPQNYPNPNQGQNYPYPNQGQNYPYPNQGQPYPNQGQTYPNPNQGQNYTPDYSQPPKYIPPTNFQQGPYPPQPGYQQQYPYPQTNQPYATPDPNCEKCKGTGYRFKHGENKKCKCVKKKEKEMEKHMKTALSKKEYIQEIKNLNIHLQKEYDMNKFRKQFGDIIINYSDSTLIIKKKNS